MALPLNSREALGKVNPFTPKSAKFKTEENNYEFHFEKHHHLLRRVALAVKFGNFGGFLQFKRQL